MMKARTAVLAMLLFPLLLLASAVSAVPTDFSCTTVTEIPQAECESLVALYNSADGANWFHQDGWLVTDTPCSWYGVTCSLGHVNNLSLTWNLLSGSIPPELGNMTQLDSLDLSINLLTGSIPPELGNMGQLDSLDLSDNQLTGSIPPELGNIGDLTELFLYENLLSGGVPPNLGSLSNLLSLHLYNNQLTGTIPSELGNLYNLDTLNLLGNQLSGNIPSELGNLASLTSLSLLRNQLSGSIPSELGNLANLENLGLSYNQLDGSIPPQLGNLAALRFLSLDNNQLSGSIPPELGNLTDLTYFYLYDNQLIGSIPPELGNLANAQHLYLHNNQLIGSIPPQLGNLSNLRALALSNNQLSGSIPPELGNLSSLWNLMLSNNQLIGSIPPELGNLANLQQLYLDDNQFNGSIPTELGNLTDLLHLVLNNNQLGGSIPPELGKLTGLYYLHLNDNQLNESIPPELGNLHRLYSFHLNNNQLSGALPLSFVNLALLYEFWFYDTDLCEPADPGFQAWLAGISQLNSTGNVCPSADLKSWTLMYYLPGDNDSYKQLFHEYSLLGSAGQNPHINIVVFYDGLTSAARYTVFNTDGMLGPLWIDERNTGDPTTLHNFVEWAKINYPAEHYALVISDHAHPLAGVAPDCSSDCDSGRDLLEPNELRGALVNVGKSDVMYMSNCLMANLEAEYQLRGLADYYVASESMSRLPRPHDDYASAIDETTTPEDLATAMAESYFYYSISRPLLWAGTISVVKLSEVESVAEKANDLATVIRQLGVGSSLPVWEITDQAILQRFDDNSDGQIDNEDPLADLYHFAQQVEWLPDSDLQNASSGLLAALDSYIVYNQAWSATFVYSNTTHVWTHDNAHGVSVALPRSKLCFYEASWLDFAGDASWYCGGMRDTLAESDTEFEWGLMLADLVSEFNPDGPQMLYPPEPLPMLSLLQTIYLPLTIRP